GAGSEHSQHAVGDQVTAYYVDGGKSDSQGGGQGPQDPVDRRSCDGSYQRDARDGVGARHQRRMQLRGHLAYQFQAQEHGQHEDEQQHEYGHLAPSTTERTRSSRITPPLVNSAAPTTSSASSSLRVLASASQACSMSR